jgi:uncharacterized membrane protein YsdA (DUF1294 family)/cold shock CspA family protein
MPRKLTARIVEWDADKGYGYVETPTQRVFLHIRDFAGHHQTPEVGDVVRFTLGTDAQGRTCATRAVHRDGGGRIRVWQWLMLAVLLAPSARAIWFLSPLVNGPLLAGLWALVSLTTYGLYALDKQHARTQEARVPEVMLHFAELLGGWPGAFLAQRRLRHKCRKWRYQVVFWLIVLAHVYVATDYQLDWRLAREGLHYLHLTGSPATRP